MKTNNMIGSLILLATLTTGASAFSAEDTSPVAAPATEQTMTTDSSPTSSSFFSPKTEEDVNKMAHVSDDEASDSAVGDE